MAKKNYGVGGVMGVKKRFTLNEVNVFFECGVVKINLEYLI